MIKQKVLIGFLVGLAASFVGLILAALLFGDSSDIATTLRQAKGEGFFGKLVSIGAILNLLVFFYFIKLKKDYHARGVILATVLIAIATFAVNYL